MTGFIFGGNTPWSYEDLQKKRTIAEELVRANMSTPRNVGEGLNAIGRALAFRSIDKKASKRDAELKGEFQSQWDGAFGGIGGSPAFAPPAMGSAPLPPVDPNNPHALGDDAMAALGKPAVKTAADPAAIKAGLVARGLPEHVAEGFVMNMQDESGLNPGINEAAPLVPGSRGGFGLYQLTGPRRVAYERFAAERGVPVDDVDAQLDFLMTELQGPEAKAAGAILSTKTPGEAGAAIVNNFLRPAPQHASARTAEYLGGAQPAGGMDLGTIAELAGSPYATPGQKAVLAALMQQQMDAMDPMRAIEMQKAQLELEKLKNPTVDPMAEIELEQARLDLEQDKTATPKREIAEDQNKVLRYIETGEPVFPDVAGVPKPEDMKASTDLRKEFAGLPEVKSFQEQRAAFERVQSAAMREDGKQSAASDLAMIFAYMKVLDPGSVVREQEFANAAKAGSFGDQIAALVTRVESGEILTPEMRRDFVKTAGKIYGEAERNYKSLYQDYAERASTQGLDPKMALQDSAPVNPLISPRPLSRTAAGAPPMVDDGIPTYNPQTRQWE